MSGCGSDLTFIVFVGVVGITSLEHNLLETHTHLMTQNVGLLSLLEKEQSLPNLEITSSFSDS